MYTVTSAEFTNKQGNLHVNGNITTNNNFSFLYELTDYD